MTFAVYPTVADEVVRYLEDGTLNETLGLGPTLTLSAGTERWTDILPGVSAFAFDETPTRLGPVGTYAPFQIAGAVTVECIFRAFELPAASDHWSLIVHEAAGDTSGANTLWSLKLWNNYSLAGSPPVATFGFMHESGSGADNYLAATDHSIEVGGVYHLVARRGAASGGMQTVDLFLNRQLVATGSLTQASGGTTSTLLRVGNNPDGLGASAVSGAIGFIRVCSRALSDAEIEAAYDATLGGVFGARLSP